jgi:hypothetical protein
LGLDGPRKANFLASESAAQELNIGGVNVRANQVSAIFGDRLASALDFLSLAELVKSVHVVSLSLSDVATLQGTAP